MARRHAVLVAADSLVRVAKSIELAPHIRMSPAEVEQGGRDKPAILADVCEAVIAAIYLDAGLPAARRFVRSHWVELVEEDIRPPKDPKTALQEWAQARSLPLPTYRQVDATGPDHAPLFTVEVSVAESDPSRGWARRNAWPSGPPPRHYFRDSKVKPSDPLRLCRHRRRTERR